MTMLNQALLRHLHLHLGAMFLQAQIGVLFEPPVRDPPLAYPAQNLIGRRVVGQIICSQLCKPVEVVGEKLGA
jgi:hypothetical protein